jgi:hypothetical protein
MRGFAVVDLNYLTFTPPTPTPTATPTGSPTPTAIPHTSQAYLQRVGSEVERRCHDRPGEQVAFNVIFSLVIDGSHFELRALEITGRLLGQANYPRTGHD